jgi:hypothetical protein
MNKETAEAIRDLRKERPVSDEKESPSMPESLGGLSIERILEIARLRDFL